ncbi:MAG TPA: acido-empty-quinoprotein group A [Vicinamibacterales bacterium]|nr:acido-empty-quinoprotein group A [Vicinamibacterales bacterium]
MKRTIVALGLVMAAAAALAAEQGLDPSALGKPPTDTWPTFNGDYTARRYSTLDRITTANVKALSLAWIYQAPGGGPIKATPLEINGVLYFSTPDHAYGVDARTGRELWHYAWASQGGNHLGNRGMAALGDTLYFETPDCHLVALDMKDGSHRWDTRICDSDLFYYASTAPVIIKNHLMTGVSGDDMDNPGYLDARDPATGALQWRWYTVPQKAGDPGLDTWPDLEAAQHGGGMTWQPVTYDPELNLVYLTTGNPQPVVANKNRPGANLFTASIVALDLDTGKMAWHFQASPHDTHDWDATEPAVLIDGTIDGRPRKLVAQASRNGHFFVLDRTNGQAIVSTEFVKTNWSKGNDAKGQPIPDPGKMPQIDGALVSPDQGGAANWPSPSFSPKTGLFYVNASRAFSVYYLYDLSDNPMGWGGTDRGGWSESMLQAIDYRTGAIRWSHKWPASAVRSGLLTTAGNVLFTAGSGGLEALDAATGAPLWHARFGPVTNAPITFELDGQQYVVVGSGASVVSFVLNR